MKSVISLLLACTLASCGGSDDAPPTPETGPEPVAVALGKVHLQAPLVGASVELQNQRGERLATVNADAGGVFLLPLPPGEAQRVRLVATGGTYQGQPFGERLLLDVERLDDQSDLHVNAATTLISRYLDRHPAADVADASARVKAFLQIPSLTSAGFDLDNPHQNHFRHELLLQATRSGGVQGLGDAIVGLVAEMDAGVPTHSFGRRSLSGSPAETLTKFLKFLGKAVGDDWISLGFEALFTKIGIDGTAEILQELHEINHKLDVLTELTREVLVDEKDTHMQALVRGLANDVTDIQSMYRKLTVLVESRVPACLIDKDGKALDPACEEQRQARLKVLQDQVRRYRSEILQGAHDAASFERKLQRIAEAMVSTPVEPGLLARAMDLLRAKKRFEVPAHDPNLVNIRDYYQTMQAMAVHLLVEATMVQEPPADYTEAEKKAFRDKTKIDAQAIVDGFQAETLQAQENRMQEVRYQRDGTVMQLSNKLIWLRAPISQLRRPKFQYDLGVFGGQVFDMYWNDEAARQCRGLAASRFAGLGGWRLPTDPEFHALVKGSPNDSGNADGGTGIFDWLVGQGFERAPGDGSLNQRGILVDASMKTAYFSSAKSTIWSYEALWDYGVDYAYVAPYRYTTYNIPAIAGAWCVTQEGATH